MRTASDADQSIIEVKKCTVADNDSIHGVVVATGVVIWSQPILSILNSFTKTSPRYTTTVAGKVRSGGSVQVIRDRLVGLIIQLLSCPAISTFSVALVKSGGVSTSLKLIKFPPVSHIVTRPVNRGDPVGAIVAVAATVEEASTVGVSAAVGELVTVIAIRVDVGGTMPQNKRSRSPFVAEKDGSESKSLGPIV